MMRRRLLTATVPVALLLGSGVAQAMPADDPATAAPTRHRPPAPTTTVPARYLDQDLAWTLCDAETGTECAFVTVPRDWNRPDAGVDIEVAVSRTLPAGGVHATTRYAFGNPGGPGAAGLGMAPYLALGTGLRDHVGIGFDVRGTGSSTTITCLGAPGYTMDPRDRDARTLRLTDDASRMVQRYCTQLSDGLLPYVTTEQTVRDVDLVRALLGAPTIDYVGYSGGTWLGAYYATYFPTRVGRFVLDSNTDFTRPWNVTFEAQPQSFERRFREDFAPWVATYDATFHLGATAEQVRASYERTRAYVKAHPTNVEILGLDLRLDQNLLDSLLITGMYSKARFEETAMLLGELSASAEQAAARGGRLSLRDLSAASRAALAAHVERRATQAPTPLGPSAATFAAITCNDTPWPRGAGYGRTLAARLGPKYPLVGWSVGQTPCPFWDRPALRMPTPTGAGLPTTLMVQSVHDPATNASLATAAHARFAGSRLVTVTNEGDHGIYGGVNDCVDTIVNRFLESGVAPSADTTCVGAGIPAPVGAAGRGARPSDPLARVSELGSRIAESIG